jgi:polysaccharide pyruvyl transferase WcaK-like protein
MRIAHFGTFDVENYGDLLFPGLVEHGLRPLEAEVVHVSPLGGQPYEDVPACIGVESVRSSGQFDAVVIGGGNIVHARSSSLPDYRRVRRTAYSSLWMGAAQLAARQDIPLVFNAPGVPRPFVGLSRRIVADVVRQAVYVAVRDERSRDLLSAAGAPGVEVVPDTALALSDLIPVPRSSSTAVPVEGDYFVAHVNSRYGMRDDLAVAARIDSIARDRGARPVLVAIGPCHGDDETAERVARLMSSDVTVIARPRRVRDVAATIAGARFYVGSSLHGFITASTYGVPGVLIADRGAQHKFLGLLEQLGEQDRMVTSWGAAEDLAAPSGNSSKFTTAPDLARCRTAIAEHWTAVRSAVTGKSGTASAVVRRVPMLPAVATAIPRAH